MKVFPDTAFVGIVNVTGKRDNIEEISKILLVLLEL